jgi:hypothetical protein
MVDGASRHIHPEEVLDEDDVVRVRSSKLVRVDRAIHTIQGHLTVGRELSMGRVSQDLGRGLAPG